MVQLARDLKAELQKNNLEAFGQIIHEGWELKRSITPEISSGQIDDWYASARQFGATGGKLLGAGSGGFPPHVLWPRGTARCDCRGAESTCAGFPIRFEPQGSRIILSTTEMSGAVEMAARATSMTAPTVAEDAAGCVPDKRANCMRAGHRPASNSMAQMKDIR